MVWWRIAWRNLWRNRRRTLITAGALAFGYLGAVLMVGVSDGMTGQMIDNGTGLVSGQVQITARGYRRSTGFITSAASGYVMGVIPAVTGNAWGSAVFQSLTNAVGHL